MSIRSALVSIAVVGALTAGVVGQQSPRAPTADPCSSRHRRTVEDRDEVRHRRREPAAGGARGRAGARARRQRRRRRDCDQRGRWRWSSRTSTASAATSSSIYYEAKTGKLHGLNAGGWAPTGLSAALLKSKGMERMPNKGIYTVTVPGAVAGWDALRAKFGKLPMSDLMAPAIFYAEKGFPVSEVIADTWARARDGLAAEPYAAKAFLVDGGRAPKAGEVFKNPDLAGSFRLIAAHGRAGFYEGKTAEAILAISREKGGTMTAADLREYQPEWVEPISTTYRGWTVSELPPNTQGIAALMMLNLMEPFPMGEYGFHSTKAMHVMIEAKKLAYADMLRYVADPKFTKTPVPAMLSKTHANDRAKLIDPAKAACTVEPSVFDGLTNSPAATRSICR